MYVKNLKLRNFRNYENLYIEFSEDINIIYGENAQGKTNILEAIYICASGRSHRTSKEVDMVKMGDKGYYIKVEIEKAEENDQIEILYDEEKKKKIRINEIPIKKIGNLMGHLNAVIFSPEDLLVIKEGPSERRRFIDITMCQLKPSYFYDLQQYMKILSQKNNLLKNIQSKNTSEDTLDIWNINLVKIGSRIIRARHYFIQEIEKVAAKRHEMLTDGEEVLTLKYSPSFKVDSFNSIEEIEKSFVKAQDALLKRELAIGTTLCGPQRDDYEISLNGKGIKAFGSQGQQRTAVLSIKLAEIEIMRNEIGENPVLILDDVMSELDIKRQEYLIKGLGGIQTFITCTDKSLFEGKIEGTYKNISVSKGKVIFEDL